MLLRGPDYLQDQCKVLSSTSMLQMVHLDICTIDDPVVHYAASARAGNIVRAAREAGDRRFLFIMNWLVAPHQVVVVWAVPEEPDWLASPEGLLFSRFLEMSDDERNARLKFIPRVLEAPFVVRKALPPEIPSIIGRKLPIQYFSGPDYLEVSVAVVASALGRRIVRLMAGSSRYLSLEVFCLIEGQSPEELPERMLGGFSFFSVDMDSIPDRSAG